ncbi:MAG TPA: hypothetical protein VJ867_04980 [Gemmatimonadaceae bacterium]|nr:hypothetical protein [Gemmatimonadaceae bacterium]
MMGRRSYAVAGALAGLCAGVAFATAHAFIITPIWSRMVGGLVFGVIAGAVAGWAFGELQPADTAASVRAGLRYGWMLWLSVVPVTLVDAGLRASGFAYAHRDATDAIAVALALAGGATLGALRGHSRRAVIACAIAAVVVTMAMGGPVPVGRNVRTVEILLAVLSASLVGGLMVGVIEPRLRAALAVDRPVSG